MKNLFTSLAVFCVALSSLHAQEVTMSNLNRFGFGVFAGLNRSYPLINTRFPVHFKSQNNVQVGVDLYYRLNGRSSLHVQPSWTRVKNVKPDNSWGIPIIDLTTLKIPLVYRHYVLPNRRLLFVQGGASYNYLTSSNFREEQIVYCIVAPCPTFIGPNIPALNKSAVSGIAGIGINIECQKISVPVTLQYERYVNSYLFPSQYDALTTPVKFESFVLTTGINF